MVGGFYGDDGRKERWRYWSKSCGNLRLWGRFGLERVRVIKWIEI